MPYAFTEQGVAMLSSVLKSERAIQINIQIMDTFVQMRKFAIGHKDLQEQITELRRYFIQYTKDNDTQKRFLSTAIDKEAGERYAQKVFWNINVPKGTKGSMIESYNVERESEAELLLQQYSKLKINKAKYDKINKRWKLWADLKQ